VAAEFFIHRMDRQRLRDMTKLIVTFTILQMWLQTMKGHQFTSGSGDSSTDKTGKVGRASGLMSY
jgi:hypothetical protein